MYSSVYVKYFRKKYAVPEDVEYFECQEQMNLDLHEEYQQVERVIGIHIFSLLSYTVCVSAMLETFLIILGIQNVDTR